MPVKDVNKKINNIVMDFIDVYSHLDLSHRLLHCQLLSDKELIPGEGGEQFALPVEIPVAIC